MKNSSFRLSKFGVFGVVILALFVWGCASDSALDKIGRSLKNVPTWSVILEDMKEDGTFFRTYHHKYRIVQPEQTDTTDWKEVPKDTYLAYQDYLGMTVLNQEDGKTDTEIAPPHYRYVNNPQYGSWQNDGMGNSFWVFYGQYSLLRNLAGGSRMYRSDYDHYSSSRTQRQPYFGRNKEFGTDGSVTKKTRPDFFARKKQVETAKKTSFGNKFKDRIGRTKTGFRSRAGGKGK